MSMFDWSRCIVCQKVTNEELKCPLNSSVPQLEARKDVYRSFLKNAAQFRELNVLPVNLQFEESTTLETLCVNFASWHKSCHLKFSLSKLEKAQERNRKRSAGEVADGTEGNHTAPRAKRQAVVASTFTCLFCNDAEGNGRLHSVTSLKLDRDIRQMATELNDFDLLGRISGGDLIATEAKYHLNPCLTSFRNRYRSLCSQKCQDSNENENEQINESRAFVELVEYIEHCVESKTLIFKLIDLHSLYVTRLGDLGISKEVNKSRLKNSLLEHFGESMIQEENDGRNTVLIFREGMCNLLKDALKQRDVSDDVAILAKAAAIVRKDVFSHKGFKFSGSFPLDCQEKSVPSSLRLLVSMVLNGLDIKDQQKHESQSCLTICQTVLFNTKRRVYDTKTGQSRHTVAREPPLPIYLGFNIHSLIRSKTLITKLYQLGLSVSYDRVMEIEEWLANSVSERYKEDGCVSPPCLRKGIFSVGALDNIDHNPSSTTSVSSFHGTGISIFQFPTEGNPGEDRPPLVVPPSGTERHSLPEAYSVVPPVALTTSSVSVPACTMAPVQRRVEEAKVQEDEWVCHALSKLDGDAVTAEDTVGWAAYHSSLQQPTSDPLARTALLPLFYEKAATPAMIKHGMDVIRQAIAFLNPGQTPVITLDQPLFALAKIVQWKWPVSYGEKHYVVMFGGLHMEMGLWGCLGDLLEGSGWTTALTDAEVASSGVVQAFLKASHVTRTRHAHQVTVLALHKLKQEAFLNSRTDDEVSMVTWEDTMKERSPTFLFWEIIIRYETLILIFIRAHRERDFPLYIDVLEQLVPLFFALDHINYARWVPIHVRDMKSLPEYIRQEFQERHHWVLSRTNNRFSAIPLDQVHEQENKLVKGAGGAVGLTENPAALRRWMLSGPELSRISQQFEEQYLSDSDPECPNAMQYHETGRAAQVTFQRQVNKLCDVIKQMGNPFLDDFAELVTLDSRDCADPNAAESVRELEGIGKQQYLDYVENVIVGQTKSIHDTIKKNSLPLFGKSHAKSSSKKGKQIAVLKGNVSLFAQLYVAMQNRDGDIRGFFCHEVQSFPPSLSEFGNLRLPSAKSELLKCLKQPECDPPSQFDCKVLDGAVIVHSLPTVGVSTFDDYADKVFIPHLLQQLQLSHRVDVVWDKYTPDSLKETTREKRGLGVRRKVSGHVKLPTNWMQFLRDPDNKSELFEFLSTKVASSNWPSDKVIYITSGTSVISSDTSERSMPECNHEEADTRIVVHVLHALEGGARSVIVRTVDTDIVIILVGKFHNLCIQHPQAQIWVAFGMGKHFTFMSINGMCSRLGEAKSRALPVFHAFTGCDTTSSFCGKGKKSAWQAWESTDHVTPALTSIAAHPFQQLSVDSENFKSLERMTILLYDKRSPAESVNEERMALFCKQNRALENIPPTQDALLQHARRAVYQAGIWTSSDKSQLDLPSPEEFGWTRVDGSWKSNWMTIPKVSRVCRELIKCACKKPCSRCKCVREQLQCTPLCNCTCAESHA